MKKILPVLLVLFLASCVSTRNRPGDDGKIAVSFVQVNDVYEIAPLSAGKEGGLARIATLKKQVAQKNPNTFLVMAGDFLSPSVYNSLPYEGKTIRGRQMVDAMNTAGFDLVCFGNHEFDIKESELQLRLDESRFDWVSSNAFHKTADEVVAFTAHGKALPTAYVLGVKDADGTTAKIGIISATLPFNKAAYVSYTDALTTTQKLFEELKDSVDVVVALTHQAIEDDEKLAATLPAIPVIMGGHEHDMRYAKVGGTIIAKAHANARTAYVVDVLINKNKKKANVKTKLVHLDETIALDSATAAVVQKWTDIADRNFSTAGFNKTRVIKGEGAPLDGREIAIRKGTTNLTKLLIKSMEEAAPQADVSIINAGSIRIDDYLPVPVTEYDIIRALPFGGGIREVDMKGSLLAKVLDAGQKNMGIGGYLHYSEKVTRDNGIWKIAGQEINAQKVYRVALNDFLLTGGEANLEFLKQGNPEITNVYPATTSLNDSQSDIRLALIHFLMKK